MKYQGKKNKKATGYELQVLYEDNHLIAVYKPGGWLVHSDETGDKPLNEFVKDYIKKKYDKPGDVYLATLHRLDRPVSGVVVFARTTKAAQRMNKIFQEREIEKVYWAITMQRPEPESGTLTHWIKKDGARNVATALDKPSNRSKNAKKSTLDYRLLAQIGSLPLVEVKPHTGRPHQIRVQLAKVGAPIRCDVKYGAPDFHADATIYLHARSLTFVHPVLKEEMTITAEPPADNLWQQFKHLYRGGREMR